MRQQTIIVAMKLQLSLLVISKNSEGLIGRCLESVAGLADEIVVIDDFSTDRTKDIARKYGAKVYLHHEEDFGKQKAYGLKKTKAEWVLVLDSDEEISAELKKEIKQLINPNFKAQSSNQISPKGGSTFGRRNPKIKYGGFYIPYQNHFLGRRLKYGGENYKKLVLFRRNSVAIKPALVHEKFELTKGRAGFLKNSIDHFSYRSLPQMYKKFTDYAFREARQKIKKQEKTSLKKIIMYPAHMFWARFIKDKGYKDGMFRLPLDLGFAYMEFLTYLIMIHPRGVRSATPGVSGEMAGVHPTPGVSGEVEIAFIVVLHKTPNKEIERLKKEINALRLKNCRTYFIDNTGTGLGFAAGVNEGIRKAKKAGADIFIVANPDISLTELAGKDILAASAHFDIWGYGLKQNGKMYYGGSIEPLQLSGTLWPTKPRKRFSRVAWVSGSLMGIKRSVVEKIGYFDESYFMYYEDVDYCTRADRAGLRIGIDSDLSYQHYELSRANPEKKRLLEAAWQKFRNKYGRQKFLFNFFSLNASSFLNKLLHFILFIFLVQFLTPKEYGIYVFVWAHIGLFLPLLDFGTTSYGLVHLPRQSRKNILELFSLRLSLSAVVFLLTIFLAIILKYNSQTTLFIFLTSFVILANTLSGSFLIITSIKEKLYLTSIASFCFNLFLILGLIAALVFYRSLFFIFFTNFIAYNLYALLNFYLIRRELAGFKFHFNFPAWWTIIKKSSVFLAIGLLANLYFKLDVFLLKFLKGEAAVGLYSSGYKFLEASLIIAASYNISSLPILSKLREENWAGFIKKIKKDFLFVVAIGLFVSALLYFFSPVVLPFILPKSFWESIKILRIVIFALPFILASSVFLNSIYVLGKPQIVILIFAFQSVFNFSFNLLFIPHYSYFASAYITVAAEILNTIISFTFLRKYLKIYENSR